MREAAHFAARPGDELVVFWAAFFGSGFRSVRPIRDMIGSDNAEHFVDELGLFARHSPS